MATALLATPAWASSAPPAAGGKPTVNYKEAGSRANSNSTAVNNQNNSGYVDQAPIGGINNNTQYNNSADTDYGFGGGVVCRGANLSIGGLLGNNRWSGGDGSATNLGGVVGLNIPLGGVIGRTCAALAAEILTQRQLDTCITLLEKGIIADPVVFPELARCPGLSRVMPPAPQPAPQPAPAPVIHAPIRGLW